MAKTKKTPAIEQEYEIVRIDGIYDPLKEHPKNPNKGDVATIDESLDENGWYGAVIAQKSTGYILAGNHSYREAKKKGMLQIPVIWKDVDDETAVKIMLVDNESTRKGAIDEAMVEELLAGLENLKGTGYVLASVQEVIENGDKPEAEVDTDDGGEPLDPDDIPDDVHTPEFAVMIQCKSERQQEETYRWLKEKLPKRDIRLVAV
jgi:ParB-like chromosome segregation protein Spo0J